MKRRTASVEFLLISPNEQDHSALGPICSRFGPSFWVRTCSDAGQVLSDKEIGVVLCEDRLTDGSWKNVLELAKGRICPPTVIVTSFVADDRLWAEVLNMGGYDVLAKPFSQDEMSRVIQLAAEHCERVRDASAAA